jgi:transcriptional regulator with XRE-family HTH domain
MDSHLAVKLRAIRKAEGLTPKEFSLLVNIPVGTVRNYEAGHNGIGLPIVQKILLVERFEKYTLWLMIGKTCEAAGQISPALSHNGHEKTE